MTNKTKIAIFLIGPPGAGKGTQADLLSKKLKIKQLDTGEIIRQRFIKYPNKPQTKKAKKLYDKGDLLPSRIVLQWIKQAIKKHNKSCIFSGSPRTLYEAKIISSFLKKLKYKIIAIHINISPKQTIKRNVLRNRDIADTKERIKERLRVYSKQTKPALNFFKPNLIKINGEQTINKVFKDIIQQLKKQKI